MAVRGAVESAAASVTAVLRPRIRTRSLVEGHMCVNIGSGNRTVPGWLNFDRSVNILIDRVPGLATVLYRMHVLSAEQFERMQQGTWRAVHYWDASRPIPLPSSVADFVYSSHFLEHLDVATANRVLAESFRVLKPGGVIRIVVPDMFRISEQYVSSMRRLQGSETTSHESTDFLG